MGVHGHDVEEKKGTSRTSKSVRVKREGIESKEREVAVIEGVICARLSVFEFERVTPRRSWHLGGCGAASGSMFARVGEGEASEYIPPINSREIEGCTVRDRMAKGARREIEMKFGVGPRAQAPSRCPGGWRPLDGPTECGARVFHHWTPV